VTTVPSHTALLGVAILRELGVLLAAIIIAGRSGSAFTAQIGTMQVNQEIDALRTLGLDPVEVLVLPRLFGLILTLPLLVFFADAMGLIGGGLMTWASLGISIPRFLEQLRGAITEWTLWVGVIKAPFFAAIIAMIGCYEGFNVTGSADSVGRLTTSRSSKQSLSSSSPMRHSRSCFVSEDLTVARYDDSDDDDIVIRVRGLVTRFGAQTVHDGLDLDVRRGEVLGVVGGSGTGKSVLLRTVIGLKRPEAGSIEVLGTDVQEASEAAARALEQRWESCSRRCAVQLVDRRAEH